MQNKHTCMHTYIYEHISLLHSILQITYTISQLHDYLPVGRHYYGVLRLISVFIHLRLNNTRNRPIVFCLN